MPCRYRKLTPTFANDVMSIVFRNPFVSRTNFGIVIFKGMKCILHNVKEKFTEFASPLIT